jgi:Tfp pilus assembly protein PilO
MTPLQKMRRRFIVIIAVLLLVDVGLAVYRWWPGNSVQARTEEEKSLTRELEKEKRDSAPLDGIEKKLVNSQGQVKQLYKDEIPNRWSEITERLHKLAQENGVSAQNVRYEAKSTPLPDVQEIDVSTSISGDYSKLAHFVNALERDKLLFLITQISLTGQEAGVVQLEIKFDTFLKET